MSVRERDGVVATGYVASGASRPSMVAVDVGYGYTKAVADGARLVMPSVVAPAPDGDFAVLSGSGLKHRLDLLTDRRERLVVGEAALGAGAERSWADGARSGYLPLVYASLLAVGAAGDVDVALGLPLAVYLRKDERQRLRASVEGKRVWASLDGSDARAVAVRRAWVYPQGYGAYLAALAADPGLAGEYVGLVDVGYRTTDYVLLVPGEGGTATVDAVRCGSVDVGLRVAYDAVRTGIAREAGMAFDPPEHYVERAVERGVMRVYDRDIDVKGMLGPAADGLGAQVTEALRRAWGERIGYLAVLLLAGGGGSLLTPHMKGARLVPDPVFANAEGFLLLARSRQQSTS